MLRPLDAPMTSDTKSSGRKIPAPRDLLCGGLISGFGSLTLVLSQEYRMGSLIQMGPGYFPTVLAIVLIGLGFVVSFIEPLTQKIPAVPFRALVSLGGGILAFAVTIESFGLVAAVMSSMLLSSLAIREAKLLPALLAAASMALACVAIFDWGLGLQFRAFG